MSKFGNLSAGERLFQRAAHMGEEMLSAVGGALADEATRAGVDYVTTAFRGNKIDFQQVWADAAKKLGGAGRKTGEGLAAMTAPCRGAQVQVLGWLGGDAVGVSIPTKFSYREGEEPEGMASNLLRRNRQMVYGEWLTSPSGGRMVVECRASLPAEGLTATALANVVAYMAEATYQLYSEVGQGG